MSIIWKSSADNSAAIVAPTSNALRTTFIDSLGYFLNTPPLGSYMAPISIRHTAPDAINSAMWAMTNGTTAVVNIRDIYAAIGYDGAATATTTVRYEFRRFNTATPTGGTAVTVVKKRSGSPTSSVIDVRGNAILAVTSVNFENPMLHLGVPIPATGGSNFFYVNFDNAQRPNDTFDLLPGEGLCVRLTVAAVIGQTLSGFVEWDERPLTSQ